MKRVKRSRRTRRALLVSFSSMLMCVAMLVGTTFAWFTDTASTSVNRIQAGELDVELWNGEKDEKLGSEALKWVASDGRSQNEILWEPGATYNLESFRIKNNGNLALKYKVIVNGLSKSVENEKSLLDVIAFTVTIGSGETKELTELEGKLGANAVTEKITITGKMIDTADNAYQNMSLTGIGITVVAAQDTVEYDSNGNDYDAQAVYPVIDSAGLSEAVAQDNAIVAMAEGEFALTSEEGKNSVSITADNLTISGEGSSETVLKQDESKYYKFSGDNTTLKNITIDASSRTGGNYIAVYLAGDNATLDGVTVKNAKNDNVRGTNAVDVEVAAGTTCKITNCDISGEGYLITTSSSSSSRKLNGTLLIEDTKLSPTNGNGYSLFSISGSGKLIVNRSEIGGRNSIDVDAVFTDCTFKKIGVSSFVINKENTTFVNCRFEKDFWFQGTANEQTAVTFENCYYDGTLITAENLSSFKGLIAGNTENLAIVVK